MEEIYPSHPENSSVEKFLSLPLYESIPCTEIDENSTCTVRPRRQRHRYPAIAKNVLLFGLAFWGLLNIVLQLLPHLQHQLSNQPTLGHQGRQDHQHHDHDPNGVTFTKPRKSCDCGKTIDEAKYKGCIYDTLSPAWLPPHCIDSELTSEFDHAGPGPNGTWTYYADRNHTQVLQISDLAAMAGVEGARFHVTWEWHALHCLYYWRKQFRSKETGVTVEARYDNEDHVKHCGKTFFEDHNSGAVSGVVLNADVVE